MLQNHCLPRQVGRFARKVSQETCHFQTIMSNFRDKSLDVEDFRFFIFLCFFRFKNFKMRKILCLVAVLFATSTSLLSQQVTPLDSLQQLDAVHVDTKIPIDRKNSGKTVTVINSAQLEQNAGKSVAQVLNEVAGFELNGSQSNNGQTLGYYIRGGRNRQVLIVVDGVPINDASQIANDFDLRLLPVGTIDQIEVMKGASSVLYGSGAATAVISITTKKASSKRFALHTTTVFGTDRSTEEDRYGVNALTNSLHASGTLGSFFYQASVNHKYTNGMSAIAAPKGQPLFDEDVFNNFNSRINLGVHISPKIKMSQFVAFSKLQAGFDDFGYLDANYQNETEQFRTGGHFEWKYRKGKYVFNDNYSLLKRTISSSFPAKYESKTYTFDNYLQHHLLKGVNVVLGLQGNFSKMNSFTIPFGTSQFSQDVNEATANFNFFDPYVNALYISDFGLTVSAGGRLNLHSLYGNHFVYQLNPSYRLDFNSYALKFLGSYSTAYITPSLFQIYDPIYGNENLDPEENTTLEAGLEFSKGKKFRVSMVYFTRKVENYVDFITIDPDNFVSQYQNISETFEASGVEVELVAAVGKKWNTSANYTYTNPEERFALRIPEHKVNVSLNYEPDEKTNFNVSFQQLSEREDSFFNFTTFENETITLESYHVFGFFASRQVTKNIQLFLGLDNLLDTEFEELYRYQTRGRNVRLGFTLTI